MPKQLHLRVDTVLTFDNQEALDKHLKSLDELYPEHAMRVLRRDNHCKISLDRMTTKLTITYD